MTDLPAYNSCQVMPVASEQMVTCHRLEESVGTHTKLGWWHRRKNPPFMALQAEKSNSMAEKAGLVFVTQENNSLWIRLFFFTALLLLQMEARPDPCTYDQQANIQAMCNLTTILLLFQCLAISSMQVENIKWSLQFIKKHLSVNSPSFNSS